MTAAIGWIRDFVADVDAGHGARTMALVVAIRGGVQSNNASALKLRLQETRQALENEISAAARNRILRKWLDAHREAVVNYWGDLGFPMPPCQPVGKVREAHGAAARLSHEAVGLVQSGSVGVHRAGVVGYAGVAVFDFDQTLSSRHLGVFEDLDQVEERTFGGAARVKILKDMLERVIASGAIVTLVTRNSKHVVSRALKKVGLLQCFARELIFGFEDYDDLTPKSKVILERILPILGLRGEAVMFVDDDSSNIVDVQTRCPDAKVLQSARTGLTAADCDDIVRWADSVRMQMRH